MVKKLDGKINIKNSLIAGSVAGMVAKTFVAPIDRIKIIYQVNSEPFGFKKALQTTSEIYHENGVKGMWRGNSASLMRVIPYAAIQFTVHEELKLLFDVRTYEQKLKKPFLGFLCGALAGLTAITATYPLDVARARMATDTSYKNILDVFRKSLQANKNFSLFKGYLPAVVGVVPYSGISFLIYELFKSRYFAQTKAANANKSVAALQNMILGTFVSLVGQTAIYPLDIVRRRIQTGINNQDGAMNTFRTIVKNEGLRGLFNGVTLSWIKGPIAVGISMGSFDLMYFILNKYFP